MECSKDAEFEPVNASRCRRSPRLRPCLAWLAAAACLAAFHAPYLLAQNQTSDPGKKPAEPATAQELPPLPEPAPALPPSDGLVPLRDFLPEKILLEPPKLPVVPMEPVLPPLPPAFGEPNLLSSALRLFVRGFRFTGNTVFSDRELQHLVARYAGRKITSDELEEARRVVTLFYMNKGYVNSGALLEDQDAPDGFISVQILEGRLTNIKFEFDGGHWYRSSYLSNRLRHSAGQPLNFNTLKDGLEVLRQSPNVIKVNADLKPGAKPGESDLIVKLKERPPFRAALELSNSRSPSIGENSLDLLLEDLNVTGHDDALRLRYGILQAGSERVEFGGLKNFDAAYRVPLNFIRSTVELAVTTSDSKLVEEPFTDLDIQSQTTGYAITLRHSLLLRPDKELAVGVTVDRRHNESTLLGEPFTLSPGSLNGEQVVSALRVFQEYSERSDKHVLSLRSSFNFGLGVLDATVSSSDPRDGRFFAWLGQAQYIRRLGKSDAILFVRVNGQISNDPLLALEQFSVGGGSSVRGYRENTLVRDAGFFASIELRKPLLSDQKKRGILSVATFFDIGGGWNIESPTPEPKIISSIGAGLIYTTPRVTAQLYWGYALERDAVVDAHALQDYGIHFRVRVDAF